MRRAAPYILMLLLLAPLPAVGARSDSKVSGHLGWRFADYHADGGGVAVDAMSLAQHYSLMYHDTGSLNGGRGGAYDYLLGAEFTGINNTINGADDALSTFKPLYSGQLLIAPGGLPFRLKLYCGDTHVTNLVEDSSPLLVNTLLTPGIATDFVNGKHRVSGATLAVGIQNGSYLGGYREFLSKWPRLLMDYRETEVESFRSKSPQNYRQRDLAFVSLNKKDNWFHYRFSDYQDFLVPSGRNDYQTKSYILGTIDPLLERAWINLTNWIKVSADGVYTESQNAAVDSRPVETYDVNLYAVAAREGIRSTILSSYQRERDNEGLKRSWSVPTSVRKRVDRDTSWQLDASVDRILDEQQRPIDSEEVAYLGVRLDTWQSRPSTLSTLARTEFFDGLDGTGSAQELGLELASSQARLAHSSNLLSYYLRRFSGEGRSGASVDYLEQELRLSHDRYSGSRRFGASETFQLGNGVIDAGFGHRISPVTTAGQSFALGETADRDGTTLHSMTMLYGEIGVGRDLSNRLQLLFDYLQDEAGGNLQWGLNHSLTANAGRSLRYNMLNTAVFGEGQSSYSGASSGGELTVIAHSGIERTYSHNSILRYSPSRSLTGGVSLELKYMQNGGNSLHYIGRQDCQYTHFRVNGVVRALFTLKEELSYELAGEGANNGLTRTEFLLDANYFPTRHFSLGASSLYTKETMGRWEDDSLVTMLSAAMTYPLASVRLNYSQGIRSTNLADRQERGFKVQIDKTF